MNDPPELLLGDPSQPLLALLAVFIAFQVSLSFTADFSNNFLWFFTGMLFAVIRLEERGRDSSL